MFGRWELPSQALGQAVMGRGRSQEEGPQGPHRLLTTDILAQNALGLFHRGLQTEYWFLERQEVGPESQRELGFAAPVLAQDSPAGLPRAPGPAAAAAGAPRAPRGRPGGVGVREAWGTGAGGGHGQAAGRQVEWGLALPPAGIEAAQRTPPRAWARADPGGTGPCRELPRRAGPAETRQGHLGNLRPPTTRSEPHQPPLALTAHAQGGDQASTRAGEGRGGG